MEPRRLDVEGSADPLDSAVSAARRPASGFGVNKEREACREREDILFEKQKRYESGLIDSIQLAAVIH